MKRHTTPLYVCPCGGPDALRLRKSYSRRSRCLISTFGEFGKTAPLHTLWIFAEGDSFFGPDLVKQMCNAYIGEGGKAKLIFGPKG